MNAMLLIAAHELRRLRVQLWPWALAAGQLVLLAYFFLLSLDSYLALAPKLAAASDAPGVTDLVAAPILRLLANLLLLLVPLIAMHSIAGERRRQSLPLLLGAGIGDVAIVVGKWFGVWGYMLLLIALGSLLPLSLAPSTALDFGRLTTAVLGLALDAGALAAIGVFASSCTAQPAFAATLALAINLLLATLDAGARFQGIDNAAINYFALPTHLDPFFRGIVASVDVIYFVLVAVVALALASRRVGRLRGVG